ncbi:hypothetical protein ACFSKU_19485 [Pontibacter silvestris]|uniref:Sensor of ECF-type sigma factor n=1 Tax=Pontibacter silvestris TaxID=2305183 RepID=A0ABW4X273_9BACT|nr:hypothetical protein [Pontibacter silvestris]MCC9134928.1 hypothetical protein [Pontibacter silvestris]
MNQLTLILFLFFSTLTGLSVFAQSDSSHEKRENIASAKVAFLTDKMELSQDQSQKFWPVYNEFEAKRREIVKAYRSRHRPDLDTMNNQEVKAMVDNYFIMREKELALEKEYAAKYQKVISVKQLVKMYRGEREFTKLLLKKLDDKK